MGIMTPGLLPWKNENQHRGKDKAVGNYKEALALGFKVFSFGNGYLCILRKTLIKGTMEWGAGGGGGGDGALQLDPPESKQAVHHCVCY